MDQVLVGRPAQWSFRLEADPPIGVQSATFSLFDSTGASVAGQSGVAAGVVPTSAVAAEILLTARWGSPAIGQYRCEWNVTYTDSTTDTFTSSLLVVAEPSAQRIATYDTATVIGQTRLWADDKDVFDPEWSDSEIGVALTNASQDPVLAAVMLLELRATQYAAKAILVKTATRQVDSRQRAAEMRAQAQYLRENVVVGTAYVGDPTLGAPVQMAVPDFGANADPNNPTPFNPW